MFLLDTCVVSELLKPVPDEHVVRWIRDQDEQRLCLSVITPGEIAKGISKHPDRTRRSKLDSWLQIELLPRFSGRILDVTLPVFLRWGDLLGRAEANGRPLPVVDALIGATALEARAKVATRNVGDFEPMGVEVVDPWQQRGD